MTTAPNVQLRLAACLERLDDGKEWSFYVINDGPVALDQVVLERFGHEWGDIYPAEDPNLEFGPLGPGAHVRLWRDNDDEMRMWLTLRVRGDGRDQRFFIEFPRLDRRKGELAPVPGLGKPGWSGAALTL